MDAVIVHTLGRPDCRDGVPCFRAIDGDARRWMATFNFRRPRSTRSSRS